MALFELLSFACVRKTNRINSQKSVRGRLQSTHLEKAYSLFACCACEANEVLDSFLRRFGSHFEFF